MKQSTLKDYLRESRLFQARAVVSAVGVLVLLILLVIRLIELQVFDHAHFKTLSRDNRVKVEPLPPTRGLIYDSNGVLLAQNLPAYSLEITPERVEDIGETLAGLKTIIAISQEDEDRFHNCIDETRRGPGSCGGLLGPFFMRRPNPGDGLPSFCGRYRPAGSVRFVSSIAPSPNCT